MKSENKTVENINIIQIIMSHGSFEDEDESEPVSRLTFDSHIINESFKR